HKPLGRSIGEERRGKDAAQDPTPLDLRNEKSETLQRVSYLLAGDPERQNGSRWMDDAGERGQALSTGEIQVNVVQTVRRRGIDHRVIRLRPLICRTHGPAPGAAAQLGDRRPKSQLGRKLADKGVDDLLQPPTKREQ